MQVNMDNIRDAVNLAKAEGLIGKLREDSVELFRKDGFICWPEDSLYPEEIEMVMQLHPYIFALLVIEEAMDGIGKKE